MTIAGMVAIVQARMGSSRLPGKVLADIAGVPMIDHVLDRVSRARSIAGLWLATSDRPGDDVLADHVAAKGISVFRGSETDVLSRFAGAARAAGARHVVRVTGDCPLVDPGIIDRVADRYAKGDVDFVSNTLDRSFPDGLDVEIFSSEALARADRDARQPLHRQHVTPWLSGVLGDESGHGNFATANVSFGADFSHLRWCVDNEDDLDLVRALVARLPGDADWLQAVALMTEEPALLRINRRHDPWEGVRRDQAHLADRDKAPRPHRYAQSERLFQRAGKVIPLASQTFSKSHQMYVRGASPLFLDHGYGCHVTDVDGHRYIDYVLGLLPVVFGYRDYAVDAAIQDQLERGITFSLPSPLECEVAERLVELIPSAEKVRFGKNGSDATTAAIRLARAYTGRDKIALCGYHGWHDWYIGTTVRDAGVPAAVKALSASFPYNDADALAALMKAEPDRYAAVILEPHGLYGPEPGFLEAVRALADRHGAVLVFDEIVSGFRAHTGGAQVVYDVTPDLTCVGKAMGNGMPVSAVCGRADIMALMETIFFSGTFGGEALSLAAARATLDRLVAADVPKRLGLSGGRLMAAANDRIAAHGLAGALAFKGAPWWPVMAVGTAPVESTLFISLLRQSFVENGLLMAASFNLCLAHDDETIERDTIGALDRAFAAVSEAVNAPDPAAHLRGALVRPTFQVRKIA